MLVTGRVISAGNTRQSVVSWATFQRAVAIAGQGVVEARSAKGFDVR